MEPDTPADPRNRVISDRQDAAQALAEYFLTNADSGCNAANDDLVALHAAHSKRQRQAG